MALIAACFLCICIIKHLVSVGRISGKIIGMAFHLTICMKAHTRTGIPLDLGIGNDISMVIGIWVSLEQYPSS